MAKNLTDLSVKITYQVLMQQNLPYLLASYKSKTLKLRLKGLPAGLPEQINLKDYLISIDGFFATLRPRARGGGCCNRKGMQVVNSSYQNQNITTTRAFPNNDGSTFRYKQYSTQFSLNERTRGQAYRQYQSKIYAPKEYIDKVVKCIQENPQHQLILSKELFNQLKCSSRRYGDQIGWKSLDREINEFLRSRVKVMLVMSDSGFNKSQFFIKKSEQIVKNEGKYLPLYVDMQDIKNPKTNLFMQILENYDMTNCEDMKFYNLLFIINNIDLLQNRFNIINSNHLLQMCQMSKVILIGCTDQIVNVHNYLKHIKYKDDVHQTFIQPLNNYQIQAMIQTEVKDSLVGGLLENIETFTENLPLSKPQLLRYFIQAYLVCKDISIGSIHNEFSFLEMIFSLWIEQIEEQNINYSKSGTNYLNNLALQAYSLLHQEQQFKSLSLIENNKELQNFIVTNQRLAPVQIYQHATDNLFRFKSSFVQKYFIAYHVLIQSNKEEQKNFRRIIGQYNFSRDTVLLQFLKQCNWKKLVKIKSFWAKLLKDKIVIHSLQIINLIAFLNATEFVFIDWDFRNFSIIDLFLYEAKFIRTDFSQSTFKDSDFIKCKFKDCIWINCKFLRSNIETKIKNQLYNQTKGIFFTSDELLCFNSKGKLSQISLKSGVLKKQIKLDINLQGKIQLSVDKTILVFTQWGYVTGIKIDQMRLIFQIEASDFTLGQQSLFTIQNEIVSEYDTKGQLIQHYSLNVGPFHLIRCARNKQIFTIFQQQSGNLLQYDFIQHQTIICKKLEKAPLEFCQQSYIDKFWLIYQKRKLLLWDTDKSQIHVLLEAIKLKAMNLVEGKSQIAYYQHNSIKFYNYLQKCVDCTISPLQNNRISQIDLSIDQKLLLACTNNSIDIYSLKSLNYQNYKIWHVGTVSCLAISSDSKYIVSGSQDRTIKLWSFRQSNLLKVFLGHFDKITTVCFTPDNVFIISGSKDKLIKIWDIQHRQFYNELVGHEAKICQLAISNSGKNLVSCSKDGTIIIWDIDKVKMLLQLVDAQFPILTIDISLNDLFIASGDTKGKLIIWEINTSQQIQNISQHTGKIRKVKYTNRKAILLSSGDYNEIFVWNWKKGQLLQQLESKNSSVMYLSACNSLNQFVACGDLGIIEVWEIGTTILVKEYKLSDAPNCLEISQSYFAVFSTVNGQIETLKLDYNLSSNNQIKAQLISISRNNIIALYDGQNLLIQNFIDRQMIIKKQISQMKLMSITNDGRYLWYQLQDYSIALLNLQNHLIATMKVSFEKHWQQIIAISQNKFVSACDETINIFNGQENQFFYHSSHKIEMILDELDIVYFFQMGDIIALDINREEQLLQRQVSQQLLKSIDICKDSIFALDITGNIFQCSIQNLEVLNTIKAFNTIPKSILSLNDTIIGWCTNQIILSDNKLIKLHTDIRKIYVQQCKQLIIQYDDNLIDVLTIDCAETLPILRSSNYLITF